MKRMLTLGCRLLAIYFGTLALTLFLADALRGKRAWAWEPIHGTETATAPTVPGGGNADCPPCREGWLTITDMYGGNETDHGPRGLPISIRRAIVGKRTAIKYRPSRGYPVSAMIAWQASRGARLTSCDGLRGVGGRPLPVVHARFKLGRTYLQFATRVLQ